MKKVNKVSKKTLNLNEIENARKFCRALNLIVHTRKNKQSIIDLKESALDELDKVCYSNKQNSLLKELLIFDDKKSKFILNWK